MAEPNYTLIQASRSGQPVLILLDAALETGESEAFPWLITIEIPLRNPGPAGLCDQQESSRLDDIEDALLAAISETGEFRHAGHVTGNGVREILLYVTAPDRTVAEAEAFLNKVGEPSAVVTKSHDPDWDFYSQFPK